MASALFILLTSVLTIPIYVIFMQMLSCKAGADGRSVNSVFEHIECSTGLTLFYMVLAVLSLGLFTVYNFAGTYFF